MLYDLLVLLIADYMVVPVAALTGWMILTLPKDVRYQAACRLVMSALTALLVARLLGVVYQPAEARPYLLLGVPAGASALDNPGFPSDHALFVTTVAVAVWFETRHKAATLILAGMAILVCLGRVMAYVHTPLDVVVGALIAVVVGVIWHWPILFKPNRLRKNS